MLDRIHARLHASPFLHRFTAFTRILLAVGFVPPGLKKVLGERFTSLPTTNPVGYFFDAFFQAHAFYVLVGAMQVLAGVLLLVPRTATLGAVLYAPIIVNISVITYAMGFQGTWVITGLMTLACLWLLAWDYDRLKAILPLRLPRGRLFGPREYAAQATAWALLGVAGYAVIAVTGLGLLWQRVGLLGFLMVGASGALFGLAVAWHVRQMPALDNADTRE